MIRDDRSTSAAPQSEEIWAAANRLQAAQDTHEPCPPVRDLISDGDLDAAYAVQDLNLQRAYSSGRSRVGRKIGLTSAAVQRQLGVNQPDFGTLLDNMMIPSGGTAPTDQLLQPKVEAEIAFWLRSDLDFPVSTAEEVRPAIEAASAAIEIVDSRIQGWDITIADTIADNASSGMAVIGSRRVPLEGLEPSGLNMRMTRNGKAESTGRGIDCLGDPLLAVAWLAAAAYRMGDPLRAGEVVLSGALGPMITVEPGDVIGAEITELGAVEVTFTTTRLAPNGSTR